MKKQLLKLALASLVISTVFTSCIEYRHDRDWRYERRHHHHRDYDGRW